ncbi:hypothetical protein B0H15DRAFT_950408 [Mycena belliarum]|uniref:CxC1-like cysteine cluster associated with KDZ transposases domain-containing protein n=1 Tax=Mycena belliarum TaxID=1033014 RepID=A0AAD6XLH9_9AGAR|nr:hypothetical protein B0H15DRAFT_950408 [Mycena belliae]
MSTKRKGGLSSKSRVRYGGAGGSASQSKLLPVNKSREQRAEAVKAYNEQVAGLSFVQREEMLVGNDEDDIGMPYSYDAEFQLGGGGDDEGWEDVPAGFHTLPPGEEAFLQSHAGGEAILHQMMDGVRPGSRSNRIQKQIDSWNAQMDILVDAYLEHKVNEYEVQLFSHPPNAQKTNQTLLLHGYIGASPERPAIAFSLRTLEIYRQHRVTPRFTIESLAKTLNYLHEVPRKAYLAEQLMGAYDAYLALLRALDARVQIALGRDEQWIAKNICPPCFYKLQDEVKLKLSWLGCIDGNNSLKLVDSTFRAGNPRFDNRKSTSFRWLTPAQVDRYQDEVKNAPKISMATAASFAAVTNSLVTPPATSDPPVIPADPNRAEAISGQDGSNDGAAWLNVNELAEAEAVLPDSNDDVAWLNVNEMNETDVKELEQCVNTCVERWKNAGPEARKKMFALFAVAGIFLCVCRHGHVLIMCDMIRSGELMKYPLAIMAYLYDTYEGEMGIGYDIMCAFIKTLLRSSLGRKTVAVRLRGVVPAFHGHAHNRCCQLGWHPMYVEGVGLEDFEECERTFCLSNNLASCTRLATPFHRQQQIDEHFQFHDFDKHAASGNFIFQNYRQAVEKITLNMVKLHVLEEQLHTTAADYEKDLKDEAQHLESLKHEPPEVARTVEYMELLGKYEVASDASRKAENDYKSLDYLIVHKGIKKNEITAIRTRYRTTHSRLLLVDEELSRFEIENGYVERWTSASPEYKEAVTLMAERRYRLALDKLERLTVQRLLELTKLSHMREKIGKALRTRADAIHRALNDYNLAATSLNPPRDPLTWAQVLLNVSLADFDLLRDTRSDIRQLPWANPTRLEAAALHFGITRAKEEISRLNVEIKRLISFMIDEHVDYYRAISSRMFTDPRMALELSGRYQYSARINKSIVERLAKASRLPGFSGNLFPGKRLGRDPDLSLSYPLPLWATDILGLSQVILDYGEDNDALDTPRELDGVDGEMMAQLMDNLDLNFEEL